MTGHPLSFGPRRRSGRVSLTPMIDVVFLLLIFFMLVSRFGIDSVLPVFAGDQAGGKWQGAPRLVEIGPAAVRLNGIATPLALLADKLLILMPDDGAPVVLRARQGANVQRLVAVMEQLGAAGLNNLIVIE